MTASILLTVSGKNLADAALPLNNVHVVRGGQNPRRAILYPHDIDETAKGSDRVVEHIFIRRMHWVADGIQARVAPRPPVIDEGRGDP